MNDKLTFSTFILIVIACTTVSFFSINKVHAQNNQWVWMKGSTTLNQPSVYGTKGIPSLANNPGSRYECAEWTDLQGRFWLFGGVSYLPPLGKCLNDLWMYDPATNMWAWMHGDTVPDQVGVYGVQGVPSPLNKPSAKGFAALTWVDNSGDLWLFRGSGPGTNGNNSSPNDLWRYNIAANQWTMMKGNTIGTSALYGTIGVPTVTNDPGSGSESSCSWTDNNNNLWFFGGGNKNHMWKYDISTNMWTWMHGDSVGSQPAVYGTQGIPAATNKPASRTGVYAAWKDKNGNFWIYGGWRYNGPTIENYSDMWKYDVSTNMWTWMSGSNIPNQSASYGTKCVATASNHPGPRHESRTRWVDDCGNFWLFGGDRINSMRNDLWKYNPVTNQWTWISGSNLGNQPPVYGTQGTPSPANVPSGRMGSVGWRNNDGLWLFGGWELNAPMRNDLWKYIPDKPTIAFTPNPASGCAPLNVSFSNGSTISGCNEIKSYSWNFGDPVSGANDTSSLANPSHTYTTAGTYTAQLVVSSCTGSKDSTTQIINVGVSSVNMIQTNPACNGLSTGSATVSTSGGIPPYTYLWSPSGQTTTTAAGLSAGTYTVIVTDAIGCTAMDTVNLIMYPNPTASASSTNISCSGGSNGTASVAATGGTPSYAYLWSPSGETSSTVTGLNAGIYTITITDANGCSDTQTVIINPGINSGEPYLPNAFSPNGDGENDKFCLQGGIEDCIKELTIIIYNRWGEKVFESNDLAFCWEGTYQGKRMNSAVFIYHIKAVLVTNATIENKGNVSLIR